MADAGVGEDVPGLFALRGEVSDRLGRLGVGWLRGGIDGGHLFWRVKNDRGGGSGRTYDCSYVRDHSMRRNLAVSFKKAADYAVNFG